MSPSDADRLAKQRLSRGSGAEPPAKILRVSTPMPEEKHGLFVLHDEETAVAE